LKKWETVYWEKRFMAKRAEKATKLGKLGLVSSLVAAMCDVAALAIMLPKWNFQEMIIDLGTVRKPIFMLAVFLAFVFGVAGFLLGLEGASHGEGKTKSLGWIGFWIGAVSAMAGIILGLLYLGYKF
jgi:hypothetical protein